MRVKQLISKHKLPTFIVGIVLLAVVLVSISMNIYYVSGAFQLDLSRPEYNDVRSQINPAPKKDNDFASQGQINKAVLEDFLKRYKAEADKVTAAKTFGNDVLGDEELGLLPDAQR